MLRIISEAALKSNNLTKKKLDEILSNESKEINQNKTHHVPDEHNIITINFSDNKKDYNAIIEEDAIIKKDEKVLVFTID
ncbi:7957_t:CDS:2 [Cetraspora pellucida]|uniref:7957_t:CDS:1 n=1 Tax=Cetraspora pellucida TaxID=1433469 RepID=A0A9N8W8M8_9GLOM|nr:7957_t:CDS:2 [Cetraspora pellucida]